MTETTVGVALFLSMLSKLMMIVLGCAAVAIVGGWAVMKVVDVLWRRLWDWNL